MKRRLEKLGVRMETLSAADRLALIGDIGRGALVYQPTTMPPDDVGLIDLDNLAEESRILLLGDDAGPIDKLARLDGASGGERPKVYIGIASDGMLAADGDAANEYEDWIVKFAS